jgi:hypothetical protein
VALSLGFPPPDVIRRRIRMEPGLSSASKRRPSGRLADAGIGGRRGGGQAESDAVVEPAGLSEPPAREPRPRSFIVASRELWDCAARRAVGRSPRRIGFGRLCGRRNAVLRPSGAGRDGRFRSHDKDSGSFLGACRRHVRLGLPDTAAAECAFRRHARRWHGCSYRFGGLRRERRRRARGRGDRRGHRRAARGGGDASAELLRWAELRRRTTPPVTLAGRLRDGALNGPTTTTAIESAPLFIEFREKT